MSDRSPATARGETPMFFAAGDDELFGILTDPVAHPLGLCAIHLIGKGASIATVNRGRITVLLARHLAAFGFHSLRMEYRGTGDSTGTEREWSISEPILDELEAAMAMLRGDGHERFVLVGTCGGARMALEAARIHHDVAGVVLLLPPMRDTEPWRRYDTLPLRHLARRLLQRRHLKALLNRGRRKMYIERARSDVLKPLPAKVKRRLRRGGKTKNVGAAPEATTAPAASPNGKYEWIGPRALHGLQDLVTRGVPILMYFGDEDNDYRDWLEAKKGPVGPVLERAGDRVRVVILKGRFYDNPSPTLSCQIAEQMSDMLATVAPDRTKS